MIMAVKNQSTPYLSTGASGFPYNLLSRLADVEKKGGETPSRPPA
jgi:hypothetical protein